jgi:hypothetical protein
MRSRLILWLLALSLLAGCSPHVVMVSGAVEPVAAIPLPNVKIFPDRDHVDARTLAHAIGTLVAEGDSGLVSIFLEEVERETSCRARAISASAPAGTDARARLAHARDETLAQLREDATISYLGDSLLPVSVPFKVHDESSGRLVDAAWVGIIVFMRCAAPSGPVRATPGGSLS